MTTFLTSLTPLQIAYTSLVVAFVVTLLIAYADSQPPRRWPR